MRYFIAILLLLLSLVCGLFGFGLFYYLFPSFFMSLGSTMCAVLSIFSFLLACALSSVAGAIGESIEQDFIAKLPKQ
jgi:hypothetical protein